MNLSASIDVEKLKALPRRLKIVGGVVAGGLAFILTAFLIDSGLNDQEVQVGQLRGRLSQLRQQSADLRRQVDQYPELRAHYESAIKSGILAPFDRVGLVNNAQDLAGRYHLANLTYSLDPQNSGTAAAGKYQQGAVLVDFENGGLLDVDVMAFWDELLTDLPAHYKVVSASLDRTGSIDGAFLNAVRTGQPASLLHAKVEFMWIALHPSGQDTQ